jgi:hypothetical protein
VVAQRPGERHVLRARPADATTKVKIKPCKKVDPAQVSGASRFVEHAGDRVAGSEPEIRRMRKPAVRLPVERKQRVVLAVLAGAEAARRHG